MAHTHTPGRLFDSLLEAKQPLMIWIFAISDNFFSDPLFAGRFVGLLFGSLTLIGIYSITIKLFNRSTAILAAFLYSIIPIFVFYNRQALMEAAIAAVGIWSFYALISLLYYSRIRNGIVLGSILGIGFFIKSSSLIFIVSSLSLTLFYIVKFRKKNLLFPFLFSLFFIFAINIPLLVHPLFQRVLATNINYLYNLKEIFSLPVKGWIQNFTTLFEIGFFYVTPFVFIFGIFGSLILIKSQFKYRLLLIIYFVVALLSVTVSGKHLIQRYVVSFLPFLIIPASIVLNILWKGNLWKKSLVTLSVSIPFILSVMLIFQPQSYIKLLSKISNYSDVGYIYGQTSGYGINEVINYIKEHTDPSRPVMVLFALNSGNPENAIDLYAAKSDRLLPFHIDSKFFPDLKKYNCINSNYPTFFVARENQLAGLNGYFSLEKSVRNPDKKYYLGIYSLKKSCEGKTLSLSDVYYELINITMKMKKTQIK